MVHGENVQRELTDFDKKLREKCERIEDAMFDRENRLALLKSGNFAVPENSIISALFFEARNREVQKGRFPFSHVLIKKKQNGEKKK